MWGIYSKDSGYKQVVNNLRRMANRVRFQAQENGFEMSEPWNTNFDVKKHDCPYLITV